MTDTMVSRHFHIVKNFRDDVIRGQVFGLGLIAQNNPVPQHVQADGS